MAENSKQKSKRAENLAPYHWQKGQSGNPSGRPRKKHITELYEQMLEDPKTLEAIRKAVLKAISRGSMAMVLQLREMTERVEGKVVQPIEADITVNLADAISEARKRAGMPQLEERTRER
ncbi:DUF5681 domain-containing protein [Edaphobacter aggregans]|uniref:DUF5681 domain-containing protein n=1 Tax=Edaphobacter aggregans TaxID=570835 RepID=UPI00054D87D2|nr:DUF5681 domain-containing protein [Edaphobacter aggregans]